MRQRIKTRIMVMTKRRPRMLTIMRIKGQRNGRNKDQNKGQDKG